MGEQISYTREKVSPQSNVIIQMLFPCTYRYMWISNHQLLELPMTRLLSPGGILAVWVTNKRSIAHFVQTQLFEHWDIEYIAEWYWIKVY